MGAAVLFLSLLFVGVDLVYNRGHLIAPLDDAYIHLQYARQLAAGHFFQYNTGDPISTGASSLLYALLLGAIYAVGFQGPLFLGAAVVVGSLCMAATAVCVYMLGRQLVSRQVGIWAAVLVAINGALLWGATSGMEVGLLALLVSASLVAFVGERPSGRFVFAPVVAALAALTRPEGTIFAVALCAAMCWHVARAPRSAGLARPSKRRRIALALIPVGVAAAQLLFYKIATGTTAANGVQAKSFLYWSVPYPTEVLDRTLGNVQSFLGIFSGLTTQDFVFPGALAFFVLGAVYLVLERPAWRPLVIAVGCGLGAVVVATSTLATAQWHNLRYLQPFIPVFALLAVTGIYAVAQAFQDRQARMLIANGLLITAAIFSVAVLPTWALRLGQESATIREGPVSISHWLQANLPPGAKVGVNDVGASAYLSGHRIVDLVGLTTDSMAAPTQNGPGSLYEALRHMAPNRRPDYFSVYNAWPGPPVHDLQGAGVFGPGPIMTFRLQSPPHPVAAYPPPCESDHSCPTVSIYKANWSLAGRADQPQQPAPGFIRDYLNVGYLKSESSHSYRPQLTQIGIEPIATVKTVSTGPNAPVADSGRSVVGGETFTAHNLSPHQTLTIQGRADPGGLSPQSGATSRSVKVFANGNPVGTWSLPWDPRGWSEPTFTIPGELVTGSSLEIKVAPVNPLISPYPTYTSFGYWLFQDQPPPPNPGAQH